MILQDHHIQSVVEYSAKFMTGQGSRSHTDNEILGGSSDLQW